MKNKLLKFILKNKIKILSLILVLLIAGISIIISFAYFTDSFTISGFSAFINYFENPDLNITVYVEDINEKGNGAGTYTAYWSIPESGYDYSSGECDNNASFTVSKDEKSITIDATGKTSCEFYYDLSDDYTLSSSGDIVINVLKKGYGEEEYTSADYFSYEALVSKGFVFTKYECTNGATASFDSTSFELTVATTSLTECDVYFAQ